MTPTNKTVRELYEEYFGSESAKQIDSVDLELAKDGGIRNNTALAETRLSQQQIQESLQIGLKPEPARFCAKVKKMRVMKRIEIEGLDLDVSGNGRAVILVLLFLLLTILLLTAAAIVIYWQ